MDVFKEYVASIEPNDHRERMETVLEWVIAEFPELTPQVKWNTPMFTHHNTFIIGFSTAKPHMSVSPEAVGITRFTEEIAQAGYNATKGLFKIRWNQPVDYDLLREMIEFNIQAKEGESSFWRKSN